MDTYEVAVLYHPDLEIDLDKGAAKVKQIIENAEGTVVSEDVWGKRKLAYKIGSSEHALYAFYEVEMPGAAVSKIEANLKITDEVLRFLVTKLDKEAIEKAKAFKAKRKQEETKESSEEKENENDK